MVSLARFENKTFHSTLKTIIVFYLEKNSFVTGWGVGACQLLKTFFFHPKIFDFDFQMYDFLWFKQRAKIDPTFATWR
jgi:hypothetical protein